MLISNFVHAGFLGVTKVDCGNSTKSVKACEYSINEDLVFKIIGVGTDTAQIHVIKSDSASKYLSIIDTDTHCIRIINSETKGTLATVSMETGKLITHVDSNCTVSAGVKKHNKALK